jgi:hypothetical protein
MYLLSLKCILYRLGSHECTQGQEDCIATMWHVAETARLETLSCAVRVTERDSPLATIHARSILLAMPRPTLIQVTATCGIIFKRVSHTCRLTEGCIKIPALSSATARFVPALGRLVSTLRPHKCLQKKPGPASSVWVLYPFGNNQSRR